MRGRERPAAQNRGPGGRADGDTLGQTCWARHVGRDMLGETRWARHVGRDMLGETCWARHVGRDTLGETRWAREGEGGASRAIELGREKVAVRESSGERQEPWHPHTTERCEPARDPPRRALAETDPAERAPAFWVAHLVERVGSVCEYDCELVAISNASGEELSKEVESLFVGAL